MATFGYCMVSTQEAIVEGERLDFQRRQIERYAMMHGLGLDEIVVEEGFSGAIPLQERAVGARLFAKLQPGDLLIAANLHRLFRSARDALNVVGELRARGAKLHVIDLGGDIVGNGLSDLFLRIAAAFAEIEHDRIRDRLERIERAKADQKARGRYLGGKV